MFRIFINLVCARSKIINQKLILSSSIIEGNFYFKMDSASYFPHYSTLLFAE